jgi:hypothetical protein
MRRISSHLTYANVVASLALFLALTGGTAVALSGTNTVFSDDIVDGQVKKPDIADGSVGSGKLIDGSIASADISPRAGKNYSGRALVTGGSEPKSKPVVDVPGFGRLSGFCGVGEPPYFDAHQETDFQNSSGGPLQVFVDNGSAVQQKVLPAGASFGVVDLHKPGRVVWQAGRGTGGQTRLTTITATGKIASQAGNQTASCAFQAQALAQGP